MEFVTFNNLCYLRALFLDNKNANSSDLHSFITKIKGCHFLIHFWKEIQTIKAKNWVQQARHYLKTSSARVQHSGFANVMMKEFCLLLQRITLNRWSHWSRHCCNQTSARSDLDQKGKVKETPDLWPPDSSQQEENSEKTAEAWQFNAENLGIKILNGFLFNIMASHINASSRPTMLWIQMFYF